LTQTSAETSDGGSTSSKYTRIDKLDCIEALMSNSACLLVDDFHYIDKPVQKAIIQGIKGPVMQGLTVFLLAVPHRAFDPMTVENEVEGRFKHIEIPDWELEDLLRIPQAGFEALKINTTDKLHQRICQEAFGNPLLVQEACSEFCLANNILRRSDQFVDVDEKLLDVAFREISKSKGFPKFQKLKKGPQARKMRQSRVMKDGGAEDIYSAIMMAIARTGPKPVTTYDEIRASMKELLGEGSFPQKNEITSALNHMSKIAKEKITGEPPLEWVKNDDELVITDPFLLFYMKYAFVDGHKLDTSP
jgi:hypothetical protein